MLFGHACKCTYFRDAQTHGSMAQASLNPEEGGNDGHTFRVVFTDSSLNTELRCILQDGLGKERHRSSVTLFKDSTKGQEQRCQEFSGTTVHDARRVRLEQYRYLFFCYFQKPRESYRFHRNREQKAVKHIVEL